MAKSKIQTASNEDVLAGYITIDEFAEQINRSKRTVQRLHSARKGPKRIKIGSLILYHADAVRAWLESNTQIAPEHHLPSLDIKKAILLKKRGLTRR